MTQNLRALVIDDDIQVSQFVAAVLRDDGWETSEAISAEQAFELSHEQEWSAVFCDVMLGGADGFSVLHRFKDQAPATKVVLMTGHGSAGGALDATAFGAYDYLLKPFCADELQTLSQALPNQVATRRSAAKKSGGQAPYRTHHELQPRPPVPDKEFAIRPRRTAS